jgi:hypothetical protein
MRSVRKVGGRKVPLEVEDISVEQIYQTIT